jgi:hypothetical protein
MPDQKPNRPFWKSNWVKGMGLGAFMFFLIKGLIWLAVFFGLFKVISC